MNTAIAYHDRPPVIQQEDVFAELDRKHVEQQAPPDVVNKFGSIALSGTMILDLPPWLAKQGYIWTNPSTTEQTEININGEVTRVDYMYCRVEPPTDHLGKTLSVPFKVGREGTDRIPKLTLFEEAPVFPGEDPRIFPGVAIPGLFGKTRHGSIVTTVYAAPSDQLRNPDHAVVTQRFHFVPDKDERHSEQVAELPGKDTTLYALAECDDDVRLDVFPRNKPHINYMRIENITKLTAERAANAPPITEGFYPNGYHGGTHRAMRDPCFPNLRVLQTHEAYVTRNDAGETVENHYRIALGACEVPEKGTGRVAFRSIGVIAVRSQFPNSPPKISSGNGKKYDDVIFGGFNNGTLNVGVGDSEIGMGFIFPTHRRVA